VNVEKCQIVRFEIAATTAEQGDRKLAPDTKTALMARVNDAIAELAADLGDLPAGGPTVWRFVCECGAADCGRATA
jgi:hypothetical protein